MRPSERLASLAVQYDLPANAAARFERLLEALAAEVDPHTTITDPLAAADQHIADSLSALELEGVRNAKRLVDIGAGAGFPGLALAIAIPDARVDLVESARRKCAVIGRLAVAAGLDNARPIAVRAEDWAASDGRSAYDLATARAVAPLPVLVEYAAPLLTQGGRFVAWKGVRDPVEESAAEKAAGIVGLRPIEVTPVTPFASARNRNLHLYLKDRETPSRFPRRPGAAVKRPLA